MVSLTKDGKILYRAALLKSVYEVDTLKCPKPVVSRVEPCGSTMKIVAFIEESLVIEKILRHYELWKGPAPHPPPVKILGPPKIESGPELDYQFTSTALSACFDQISKQRDDRKKQHGKPSDARYLSREANRGKRRGRLVEPQTPNPGICIVTRSAALQ
jgi:hypothetical protein